MTAPDVLTIPQAARRLGKAPHTLRRLIAAGEFPLPVVQFGTRSYIGARALDAYINGSDVASTPSSHESAVVVEEGANGAAGSSFDTAPVSVQVSRRPAAPTSR